VPAAGLWFWTDKESEQEGHIIRICIPTDTDEGLGAKVNIHFGSAPYFTIYDTDKEEVTIINNENKHHAHGMCQPMTVLESECIDCVLCSGMGVRAVIKLNEGGIRAYRATTGTVRDIAKLYKESRLKEITPEAACDHTDCH